MNIEQCSIHSDNSHLAYKFKSIGPNGIIRKVVRYTIIQGLHENYYNLSFGDWDEVNGIIDDHIISNNKDTEKVLLEVARTALQFLEHFPKAKILILGRTRARIRLYQMSISKNITELNELVDIKGFKNGHLKKFEPGINYEGFLICSK
jgi:hypothetical protein